MADQSPQSLDLTPEIVNLEVQQETDVVVTFQLLDGSGNPVDITNDEVKFTAKDDFDGVVKIPTKTNGVGQHADPAAGKTTFTLTKANLATATPTDQVIWKYEVRRIFVSSGREVVYIHGDLNLMPSVGTDA